MERLEEFVRAHEAALAARWCEDAARAPAAHRLPRGALLAALAARAVSLLWWSGHALTPVADAGDGDGAALAAAEPLRGAPPGWIELHAEALGAAGARLHGRGVRALLGLHLAPRGEPLGVVV